METTEKVGFSTVDEYLRAQPVAIRAVLEQLRQTIKNAAPEAQELISYQMPAFRFHGRFVWYAANKNHCGLYILPKVLQEFRDKLSAYKLTKSAIQLPFDKPLPTEVVIEIITYAVQENLATAQLKDAAKQRK